MKSLNKKIVVVAGGTGNVGSFLVKELLKNDATVAVPSRSTENLQTLKTHLSRDVGEEHLSRLHTFSGDIGKKESAEKILDDITGRLGVPDAAIASLGKFLPAPSLLDVDEQDLLQVINGYLIGHFTVVRTFLKRFKKTGGTYVFINGPLALEPWEGSGAGLVSIATAGQQMLFKALAQELKDSKANVVELITHAFIRNKETQSGSPIPGEAVGDYASYLVSGEAKEIHGKSIQLRSMSQLEEIGW